ncbi:MAG: D-aminoacylase [Promethearchaeota archaeon]|nr:MAG: D-aminoacylase [Candidatus Lokiarchaeota archaeon]
MAILIKNGTIIDGTGSSRYKADILINGDRIEKMAPSLDIEGAKIIEATNKIVSPGFIDMHNHADLTILKVNKVEAYVMQGCTTLVVGMCGIGLAPANDTVRDFYEDFVTKIFGSEQMKLFDTLTEYFKIIEEKGISLNLAFFIPQGNVRASVLGVKERPPTLEELEDMKKIVKQGMEAGAFGLSTGLIYPPGSVSTTEELIELWKVVREYGGIYDSHMRNEGTGVVSEGMAELLKIAREANVQGHISHWKAGSSFAWKLTPDMVQTVKDARKEGLTIYVDMYPYDEGSTSLSGAILRPWVYENFKENLTNPETRQKIVEQTLDMFFENFLGDLPWLIKKIPKFIMKRLIFMVAKKTVRIISVTHHHEVEGKMLGEALKMLYPKKKFVEALLDFVRDEEGTIMVSFKQMSEEKSIFELIKQDFVSIGSDGFLIMEGNTHPRSYGTFPKILGNYVRQKNLFSLEEGIRKMTGLPATILGLKDRGVLKPNYKADIVIFDANEVIDTSTYQKGTTYPKGIDYVIVNGELTVAEGNHLGTLKGTILKHSKNDKRI